MSQASGGCHYKFISWYVLVSQKIHSWGIVITSDLYLDINAFFQTLSDKQTEEEVERLVPEESYGGQKDTERKKM